MKRNIYASIEFGTHSIKLLVSEFFDEKQNILFIDEVLTSGIDIGKIRDKSIVINDVKKLIDKCENFLSAKINSVVLMLPSIDLISKEVNYDLTIPDNKVKGNHLKNLFNKVYTEEMKSVNQKGVIAYIYPNTFTSLKMKKNVDNPIGEITRQLAVSLEVIYANQQVIIEYLSVLEELGIEVIEIMPNVVGYKKSLLTKEECVFNTCVVDVGAHTTTITVYKNNLISHSETFKLGTSTVTEALKEGLSLSLEDAEDFKITHGNCLVKEATDEIVLEKISQDDKRTFITNKAVSEIVEEKYLEIIRVIRRYLLEIGMKNKIRKYILIGGGVAIENFEKLFKHNFGEKASIRTPNLIGTRHPKYSGIISGQYNILYLENLFEEQYNMVTFKKDLTNNEK